MFLYMPTRKTINEYNRLRQTQEPVKVNSTSKRMDNLVYYGKKGYTNMLAIFSLGALLTGITSSEFMKNKPLGESTKKNMLCNLALQSIYWAVYLLAYNTTKQEQKYYLSSETYKINLYKKHGINMVR